MVKKILLFCIIICLSPSSITLIHFLIYSPPNPKKVLRVWVRQLLRTYSSMCSMSSMPTFYGCSFTNHCASLWERMEHVLTAGFRWWCPIWSFFLLHVFKIINNLLICLLPEMSISFWKPICHFSSNLPCQFNKNIYINDSHISV